MSMQRKVYDCVAGCPVESTLQIISGKWKSVILYRLFQEQVARYSDFERWLPTISSRMLARQLQELVADGVVTKQIYAQIPAQDGVSADGVWSNAATRDWSDGTLGTIL